ADKSSESRYPALHSYLRVWKILVNAYLILHLAIAGVLGALSLILPFMSDFPFSTAVINSLPLLGAAIATAGIGGVIYVVLMASIQFIHVIIDIEANTRRLAENAE
ncbi:MAG: hypothetical protein ACF8TS_23190, partial [Maioricimonas sp. JB049]